MRNIAVIGGGRWGTNHLRTMDELGALAAAVDTNPERCAEISGRYPEIKVFNRLDSILDDPGIVGVTVATPADTHYDVACRLLEGGKHVLVEKPLALHSSHAEELIQLASSRQRILMVGHLLLYHPAIRKIKELIEQGRLGTLQYIYSNRLNLGTVRKAENILWSFAPHDIAALSYLVGDAPVEVDAKGGVFLQPGIHDVTVTHLRYPNNIVAHIHVSWLHPFKEHRLVVIGDRSMVVFEDAQTQNKLVLYSKGIDLISGSPVKRDGEPEPVSYEPELPLTAECRHFIECIRTGSQPLTDGANGLAVLMVLEKAQAALTGSSINPNEDKPAANPPYFVHPSSFVDERVEIGAGTKIWHFSHIQSNTRIGRNCSLGQNVNVGSNVVIGNFVKIQNNVSVYEGVILEDYVFCGPSMVFTNIKNPRSEFPQRGSEFYQRTLVKRSASIGANATVICGTTLGRYSFVGAGAMVVNDVPDFALVLGNPAKVTGWMCKCGTRLDFSGSRSASCPKCTRKYEMEGENKVRCLEDDE